MKRLPILRSLKEPYEDYLENDVLEKVPHLTWDGIKAIAKFMEKGLDVRTLNPEQFMDSAFVKELEESGFIKSIWK